MYVLFCLSVCVCVYMRLLVCVHRCPCVYVSGETHFRSRVHCYPPAGPPDRLVQGHQTVVVYVYQAVVVTWNGDTPAVIGAKPDLEY